MGEKLYIIRNWDVVFEKYTTRDKNRGLDWVSVPTAQDGEAFNYLARTVEGVFAIGVFQMLAQWTGRQLRAERGILRDHKGPFTPYRIHARFGVPLDAVEKAWNTLASQEIGWLVEVDDNSDIPTLLGRNPDAGRVEVGCASDATRMQVGCAPDAGRMTQTDRQTSVVVEEAELRRKALQAAGIAPGRTLMELTATSLRPSQIAMIAAEVKKNGGKSGAVVLALREAASKPPVPLPTPAPALTSPEAPVDPEVEKQALRARLETTQGTTARRIIEKRLAELEGAA